MKAKQYDFTGTAKGEVTLPDALFAAPVREDLMHLAFVRQMSNARTDTAFAKTRTQVRGGGRKPWRQKGTGRARQGSIRSPQWRGGGVVFGPQANRNYTKSMPQKMRQAALRSALSVKANEDSVYALTNWTADAPSTKSVVSTLQAAGNFRRVLIVLPEHMQVIEKSARNIPGVQVILAQYLNVRDLIQSDAVMFYDGAIEVANSTFSKAA